MNELTDEFDNIIVHSPKYCRFAGEMAATGMSKQDILKLIKEWKSTSVEVALESFLTSQIGVNPDVFQRRMKAYKECFF